MLRRFLREFSPDLPVVAALCFLLIFCAAQNSAARSFEQKTRAAAETFAKSFVLFLPAGYTVGVEKSGAKRQRGFISGRFVFKSPKGKKADVPPVAFLLTSDGKYLILGTDKVVGTADLEGSDLSGFAKIPNFFKEAPVVLFSKDGRIIAANNILEVGADYALKNRRKMSFKNSPVLGDPRAEVSIVEYSNFQCPYCKEALFLIRDVLDKYEGKVRLVYKHLPASFHEWSYPAAAASYCFARFGGNKAFRYFHDEVFRHQASITPQNYAKRFAALARRSGLSPGRISKCMDSSEAKDIISRDIKEAESLEVEGTPTFFVDGIRVPVDADLLKRAIEIRLSRRGLQ